MEAENTTENAVEEVTEIKSEGDIETSEEATGEPETMEAPEPVEEDIPTKYDLEITNLNGSSYEDTFLMGEYNKDENEKAIMEDYVLIDLTNGDILSDTNSTIKFEGENVYADNHYVLLQN